VPQFPNAAVEAERGEPCDLQRFEGAQEDFGVSFSDDSSERELAQHIENFRIQQVGRPERLGAQL
jgi:hypothetical protein